MVEFSLVKQLGVKTKSAVTWLYNSCVPALPQDIDIGQLKGLSQEID
jgi:hypothetical protein